MKTKIMKVIRRQKQCIIVIHAAGTARIASWNISMIIAGNVTVRPHGNECRAVPNVDMM